jgi:uncharacterized protein with PIN domain
VALARFRFHGDLGRFLRREHRERSFVHACARAATLKNAIESLGVPHTEAGRVSVNGAPATLQRAVREGDAIEVFPVGREMGTVPIFVADAHLGGLARFLRMLGYDTLHENDYRDADIRRLAETEKRIVLSRDRELLKCREIERGCFVRALKAEAQLREVAARYGLAAHARPFTLCLRCNRPLEAIAREDAAALAPPKVLERQTRFTRCAGCGRIYWPGSHYERMRAALGDLLEA